jgi:hypothetical protein
VPRPFADSRWLATLIDEAVASHDPSAARCQLPPELLLDGRPVDVVAASRVLVARSLRVSRPPEEGFPAQEVFREIIRGHVLLLLDLRHLPPRTPAPARARAEVAAFLAGASGEVELALEAAAEPSPTQARAVDRALAAAGRRLRDRFYPPGDPVSGLPLSSGSVAVFRRLLSRIAGGYLHGGRLEPDALARHARFAARELVLLAEALAGLLASAASPDRRARWVRSRQMARLGLRGALLREARRAVAAPRPPQELAVAAPEPVRGFLFEQLLLAQLRSRLPGEAPARFAEAFASSAGLDPRVVVAAQLEAAAQSGDPQAWFEGTGARGSGLAWQNLAEDWGAAADKVVDRVSSAVTQNLGALATEIRETGELGTLLTKAAAGQRLTPEEKRKVRAQLVDLAKAVPALAIFAAPGGTILLPVLAKLLPFNFLPSAWDKVGNGKTPPPGKALPAAVDAAEPAPAAEPARHGAAGKPGEPAA